MTNPSKLYPLFDADLQKKVREKLGEDNLVVFNDKREVYLATKENGHYSISELPVGVHAEVIAALVDAGGAPQYETAVGQS